MKGEQKLKAKINKENGLLGQHLETRWRDHVSDESDVSGTNTTVRRAAINSECTVHGSETAFVITDGK
jgi:hypothetical protein